MHSHTHTHTHNHSQIFFAVLLIWSVKQQHLQSHFSLSPPYSTIPHRQINKTSLIVLQKWALIQWIHMTQVSPVIHLTQQLQLIATTATTIKSLSISHALTRKWSAIRIEATASHAASSFMYAYSINQFYKSDSWSLKCSFVSKFHRIQRNHTRVPRWNMVLTSIPVDSTLRQ